MAEEIHSQLSTGLAGLDRVLKGLIPGDNIVWQLAEVEDYLTFTQPYCRHALRRGHRLIYFRFARHQPLVSEGDGEVEIHRLQPEAGFEQFVGQVHRVIREVGRGGYYLFDCLSELAVDWYSDQMLGNFFMLTCPRLFDVGAIAYFALLRNHHSAAAMSPIANTTQVLLDVLRHDGGLYLQPMKVQQRYGPTMYRLHAWREGELVPVSHSAMISDVRHSSPWQGLESSSEHLNIWNRTFLEAQEAQEARDAEAARKYFERLLRMAVSREPRMLGLAERHLTLSEVLEIGRRMIGTGLIGGKSVGMLLARAILRRSDPRWRELLEPHDSFFVGSDVFYTYLVTNGAWWGPQDRRDLESLLDGAVTARQRILVGRFPDAIVRQFADMLDYFGQLPIIVRSSSLLEDNYGNAFAGKYESVFCVNQGPRDRRLEDFLSAVRTIYASTMSERALTYRAQRGMLGRDEQMALLIQRVSGATYGELFYPQVAGVGLSFNPYVWSRDIDPKAGVLRLVFGLGTRAVDRQDDDYTRVVALNAPRRRPEANFDEIRQYAQKKVDVLDLEANRLLTKAFSEVARESTGLPLELFAAPREEAARPSAAGEDPRGSYILGFDELLGREELVGDFREMLKVLHEAYEYPVDVEFTLNFIDSDGYRINLVQCRPFQVVGDEGAPEAPGEIAAEDLVLRARGAVIGHGRQVQLDRLVYVVPEAYAALAIPDRHRIARLIGRVCRNHRVRPAPTTLLLGPGRWGTSTPSLGVPVTFADIHSVSVLCEIVAMREGLVPDVSLGTHLFSEMVEMDILYLALFPHKEGNVLNHALLAAAPNRLAELLSEEGRWAEVVRVIEAGDLAAEGVVLHANPLEQTVVCYRRGGRAH